MRSQPRSRMVKPLTVIIMIMMIMPALLAAPRTSAAPAGFRLPFVGDASWRTDSYQTHGGASKQAIDYTLPTYQTTTPWNRDIVASAAGRVVYKAFQRNTSGETCPYVDEWPNGKAELLGFGNLVILYHPSTGHYSYYAHLASFAADLPAVGSTTTVPQGKVIGVMGNTGCSSRPHLHFEIRTGVSSSNLIGSGMSQPIGDLPGMNQKGNGTATGPGSAGVACSAQQYTASIYNNTSFSGTPVTQCHNWPLNVNWGAGSPAAGIGADNFTVRWTGRATFNAGKYDFYVRSDDGIRVWVNNALIINQWDNPPYNGMNYINYTMTAGTWDIKIEYIERGGNAYAQFKWTQQQATGSPPAAPSNVQASNVSRGIVRIAWKDNANNETGFRVWDGARYWTLGAANGSGGGWYADLNGGWPSGTYKCFQMQAYNSYGNSAWSSFSCLNTK